MKSANALLVGMLLMLAQAAWAQDTERTIAALEQKWLDGQLANDVGLTAPLFAETAIFVNESGKVRSKSEFVAGDKATKYESASLEDMKVRVYGDTAIASYVFRAKGVGSDGKPFELSERSTDTWVKMPGGQWQLVATHGSLLK